MLSMWCQGLGVVCRLLKTIPADRIPRKLVNSTELPQLPNIPTRPGESRTVHHRVRR